MKFYSSPYILKSNLNKSYRLGSLLKCEWDDGHVGYSDIFPLLEFGDMPLHEQLEGLKKGTVSLQIEQSIWLARRDAVARKNKVNLLAGSEKIKNNFLITDAKSFDQNSLAEIKKQGFETIKIKIGRKLIEESNLIKILIQNEFRIRLDFIPEVTFEKFLKFFTTLDSKHKIFIEYLEDPFPYSEKKWREARNYVRLALDQEIKNFNFSEINPPFDALVVKPAKVDVDKAVQFCVKQNMKITVTSYMDHPVGQMHALAVAVEINKKYPLLAGNAGCLTHTMYEQNDYNLQIKTQGPSILPVAGYGIGFDNLLESQEWKPI